MRAFLLTYLVMVGLTLAGLMGQESGVVSTPVPLEVAPPPIISLESRLRARHILEGTDIVFIDGRFVYSP